MCNAAIAERQQLEEVPPLPKPAVHEEQSPIDITEAADELVSEQVAAHTYAVNNCPRRLTDLPGNELDYDIAVRDEIDNQTGLTPSLFGTNRPARLIENAKSLKQCEICWDHHTQHACNRQSRCKRCGKTGHTGEGCGAVPPNNASTVSDHTLQTS
ncbi:hypothetical protein QQS21_000792 [Conoideocrella luteorostrata]|uniref:CCHC-type domain-containing protein n=1 Tax=Conoideocrella luteorostrata TaxID=1105319 RepID=A0AAJ0G3V5_9HYPO|nr:hypothetical protein QQS21_000792 [Conoideocrella luteorostrata]